MQTAEQEESRILPIGGRGRRRGSGVPEGAPLLLSHSQTLSVTQALSYSVGSPVDRSVPCLVTPQTQLLPGYTSFVPGLFLGDCMHFLGLADTAVRVPISCPSF